ncbi:MAG TPA: sulfatase-like hydrolase/transferase, partial [Thermoanaerobaculia bacterium]|nr:sulfatase-like hydrolase/transferase [Thermoanaerobaculia bacterium]
MKRFLLLLVLLAACREKPVAQRFTNEPDIILVTIDTWRADSAGFSGNRRVRTPFLDRVASEGVVFENAHAHNVITLPSHVNILTGLYPFQHGVRENAGYVLDPKVPTVASMLRAKGYATGAFVGAFPLDARFGLNRGFDRYDDNYGKGETRQQFVVQERPARAVLQSARRWWDAQAGRKRFIWVHLYDAHAPYEPPAPFDAQFRDDEYLGELSYVDAMLGELLGPLLRNDALLIVTGDHGEARGDHGELTHGLFAYESTLKVPLLMREPGVVAPRREAGYVRHVDIVPTILQRVGLPSDARLMGASLFDAIGSRDSYFESLSGALNRGWAPLTGVIHEQRKYIDLPIAELYDLPRDPREQHNLRDEQRRDVTAARSLLAKLTISAMPAAERKVSEEEALRLLSLGYVSGSAPEKKSFGPEDDPKNLVGVNNDMHLIIEAYESGDLPKALGLARRVVAEQPAMPAGRILLAFVLEQTDQTGEAISNLRYLVESGKASNETKVQLALLLSESGRASDAVQILSPIVAASYDPDALNAYGIALADEGRPRDAMRQFDTVLAADPNNAPALQNLGIVALRSGDADAALGYLTRALDLNPRLPLALNTLGVVHARRGNFPAAVDAWNRAV